MGRSGRKMWEGDLIAVRLRMGEPICWFGGLGGGALLGCKDGKWAWGRNWWGSEGTKGRRAVTG